MMLNGKKLPEGWKWVPIGDLLTDQITGEWGNDPDGENDVKVIRTTNFTNEGKLDLDSVVLRSIDENTVQKKRLRYGDIILEKSGGSVNQPVGRVVYFDLETTDDYLCNNFTQVLRVDSSVASPLFVFYMLLYTYNSGLTEYYQNKTTGIRNLQVKRYLTINVPLAPLDVQLLIVSVIEKSQKLLHKKKQVDRWSGEYLQAVFFEMFGDPVINPKGWEVKELTEGIIDVKNGISRRNKKDPNLGNVVLRLRDIRANEILFDDVSRIPLDEREKEKYAIEEGDLLFIRVNGNKEYVGRCAVFSGFSEPVYFNDHIMRIKIDKTIYNPTFVSYFLNWSYGKSAIEKFIMTSAGQYTINQTGLGKTQIICPHILQQNKFAELVKKMQEQKFKQVSSLSNLELLFNSLLQDAFSGVL